MRAPLPRIVRAMRSHTNLSPPHEHLDGVAAGCVSNGVRQGAGFAHIGEAAARAGGQSVSHSDASSDTAMSTGGLANLPELPPRAPWQTDRERDPGAFVDEVSAAAKSARERATAAADQAAERAETYADAVAESGGGGAGGDGGATADSLEKRQPKLAALVAQVGGAAEVAEEEARAAAGAAEGAHALVQRGEHEAAVELAGEVLGSFGARRSRRAHRRERCARGCGRDAERVRRRRGHRGAGTGRSRRPCPAQRRRRERDGGRQ